MSAAGTEHRTRGRAALATALGGSGTLLVAAALTLLVVGRDAPAPPSLWFPRGFNLPFAIAMVGIGWMLASRRPANPVAWSVLVGGWAAALQAPATELTIIAHDRGWDTVGAWSALAVESLWPAIVVSLIHAAGRFPGHERTRLQRAVGALAGLGWFTVTAGELLLVGEFQNVEWYDNPMGVLPADATGLVDGVAFLPLVVLTVLAFWSVGSGFRRSRGIHRQQYRWFAATSAPMLLSMLILPFSAGVGEVSATDPEVLLSTVGLTVLPIGLGVAVLRYRLYELDRLVSRTVAWVLLTGLVVALWTAIALLPSALVGGGDTSPVLVAGATVIAAAAFNPLRTRLQDVVDRRLYRARYDARLAVEYLGTALAEEVDLGAARHRVVEALARTVQPTTVAVWTPDHEGARP